VAGLFTGLIGGVFLAPWFSARGRGRRKGSARPAHQCRIEEKFQSAISLMNLTFWPVFSRLIAHVRDAQGQDLIVRQQRLGLHVPGRVEVDIFLVQRVPEVIVGGGDDLVERRRAGAVSGPAPAWIRKSSGATASYMMSL